MFQAKGSSLDRCRSVAQKRRLVIQSLEDRRLLNADTPSNAASALQDGFAKGVVSGYVFQDRNGNGEQDLGDVGIPGERVFQDLNQNGLLDAGEPSQLTASDGSFQFADLQVDRYVFGLLRHIDKVSTPHQTQFSKATRISTGEGTNSVAIANLDGDSTLDLIATNGGDNSLYVGLQFASSEATTNILSRDQQGRQLGIKPIDLEIGDLDGDGRVDIATVMVTSDEINVFLSGHHAPAAGFANQCEATQAIAFASLFPVLCSLPTAVNPTSIQAVDLDGDNDLDLVVGNDHPNADYGIELFENDGSGNFRLSGSLAPGARVISLTVGDFLGSTGSEIAIIGRSNGILEQSLTIVPRQGFQSGSSAPMVLSSGATGARDQVASDLNADGRLELIVAHAKRQELTIHWQSGPGDAFEPISVALSGSASSVAAGDLDMDGDDDIVATIGLEVEQIVFLENTSLPGQRPAFADPIVIGTASLEQRFSPNVEIADVDGDSVPDVVLANGSYVESGGGVSIVRNLLGSHRIDVTRSAPDRSIEFGITGNAHHHELTPTDVDNSQSVTVRDALLVINRLSIQPSNAPLPFENRLGLFTDVTNDGLLSPRDALVVINHLARLNEQGGQGQAEQTLASIHLAAESESSSTGLFGSEQWALQSQSGVDIDAPEAWSITTGARQTVVAVIDSGLDMTHPDLYRNVWINQDEIPDAIRSALVDVDSDGLITFDDLNAVENRALVRESDSDRNDYVDAEDLLLDSRWVNGDDGDGNSYPDDLFGINFLNDNIRAFDDSGHGTHLAGIIAASQDDQAGISGVSPNVRILPIKILDGADRTNDQVALAKAIEYVTALRKRGVTVPVINASVSTPAKSSRVLQALRDAADEDILFVTSAGNTDIATGPQNLDDVSIGYYPARYEVDNVIVVAAHDLTGELDVHSNYGRNKVDLVAPGVDVYSLQLNDSYVTRNGTSMAVAFVSGVAALASSRAPDATFQTIKAALVDGTVKSDHLADLVASGGRLNAYRTLLPTAQTLPLADVRVGSTQGQTIEVLYRSIVGVAPSSLGNDDIIVRRQDSQAVLPAQFVGQVPTVDGLRATYVVQPPGGSWDEPQRGVYSIVIQPNQVFDTQGVASVSEIVIGTFAVENASGQVFRVNSYRDAPDAINDGISDDGTGVSTLRSAIMEANRAGGSSTIILQSGVYSLALSGGEDAARAGDLDITGEITIVGAGSGQTIIDASRINDRVFDVLSGAHLNLVDVQIAGGQDPVKGGAIWNRGSLRTLRVDFVDNQADRGGAIYGQDDATIEIIDSVFRDNIAYSDGGAIVSEQTLSVVGSDFRNNTAANGGAVFVQSGNADFGATRFTDNRSVSSGGALRLNCGLEACSVEINDTIFERNLTDGEGGAIYLNGEGPIELLIDDSQFLANRASGGGALSKTGGVEATVTLTSSQLHDNQATYEGGAIAWFGDTPAHSFLIQDSELINNRAGLNGGAIRVYSPMRIENSLIHNNSAAGQGGGIFNHSNLVLSGTTVSSNRSNETAGGIMTRSKSTPENPLPIELDASTIISDSFIVNNRSGLHGGGVTTSGNTYARIERTRIADNIAFDDAGGLNLYGVTDIIDCSIVHNMSSEGGGVFSFGSQTNIENTLIALNRSTNSATEGGAGIFNGGGMSLKNVTLSGNIANNIGGAVFNKNFGVLEMSHVTIADNSALSWAAIYNLNGSVRIDNTIFELNQGMPDLSIVHQAISLVRNNLVDRIETLGPTTGVGMNNRLGTLSNPIDALLGPLENNGGLTYTHALLAGSPAIDAGSSGMVVDQRGTTRPRDGDGNGTALVDIGAFELQLEL